MSDGGKKSVLIAVAVNVCRLLLALTFIFSGFIKANDPLGMVYKLNEYAAAVGISEIPEMISLGMAVGLAFIEFMLGIYLFFGISRKPTSKITAFFMGIMTLLTIYIFVYDPVADCGCFGDAIVLSNGATLAKNVVLMGAAIVVAKWHDRQIRFLSANTEWIISILSILYILAFAVLCIVTLPVFDFRPYRVGADVRQGVELPDSLRPVYEIRLVYERGDERMEIGIDDDDPDSSWQYVETKRILVKEGGVTDMSDFSVVSSDDGEDVTYDLLADEGYSFLLVSHNLMTADQSRIDLVNEVYDYAIANGYGFYCLTASDTTAQNYWTDHTGAEYGYYYSNETMLKTMVRSNPGLVLMKDGKIVRKWSCYVLPDDEDLSTRLENSRIGRTEVVGVRKRVTDVLLFFIVPVLLLTAIDRIAMGWAFYRKMKRKTKELRLENIEKKLGLEELEKNINNKFNTKNKEK